MYFSIVFSIREILSSELKNLREEQGYMIKDLSNARMRWHALREEKLKASSIIRDLKRAEEELVDLEDEKVKADFEVKVIGLRVYFFVQLTS